MLTAGVLSGVVSISFGISLASLIFSGPVASALPLGVGLVLISGLIVGLIAALTSSFPGMIAGVQGSTAAVLALATAEIAQSVTPDRAVSTVVAAIALSTLSVGTMFYVLGRFRLGGLVRYIPFPVVAGFLAGTGALVVKGAAGILGQGRDLGSFPDSDSLLSWGVGLGLAAVLGYASRHAHRLAVPVVLLVGPLVLLGIGAAFGVGVSEAQASGWLLGPFPKGALWEPSTFDAFTTADWAAIGGQVGTLASVLLLAAITFLLNVPAIELETRREIDVNRDLRGLGLANLVAGAVGGAPAYPYLSNTVLAARISGPQRATAIVAALLNGLALVAGSAIFALLPTAVVGAVLLFIGGTFLVEWAWETRLRVARSDYVLILLITLFMVVFGFVRGVVFGLVLAVFLFVYRYSKVGMIRHETRVPEYPSNVDRSRDDRALLDVAGRGTLVMELQGFLFFGTATRLIDRVTSRLRNDTRPQLRFLILDFGGVTGIDSSAVMAFEKLHRLATQHAFQVRLTDLDANVGRTLLHLTSPGVDAFGTSPDLDHGLQWCEEELLVGRHGTERVRSTTLSDAVVSVVPECVDPTVLDDQFDRVVLPAGTRLIEMGAPSSGLFFIEEGSVTVSIDRPDEAALRLRTMHAGTVVGEIGLYGGTASTASVIAETDCLIRVLSPGDFARLSTEDPDTAATLHLFIARILAERVAADNRSIEALRR